MYSPLVNFMTSGPIIAMELKANDAVARWRQLLGPTNSDTARVQQFDSIRAKYGTGRVGEITNNYYDVILMFLIKEEVGMCADCHSCCMLCRWNSQCLSWV